MTSFADHANSDHVSELRAYEEIRSLGGSFGRSMERERRFHIEAIISHEFIFEAPNIRPELRRVFMRDASGGGFLGTMDSQYLYEKYYNK